MDDGIPKSLPNFAYRYHPARHRMPYYGYYREPLGPPLSPFVTKRLPKYGLQYTPLYEPRYSPPRNIPPPRKGACARLSSPPRVDGHWSQKSTACPESQGTRYAKRNLARNPRQPYVDIYEQTSFKYPYNGMTKGPHGAINKCFSPPRVPRAPLPRATKGPVVYSPRDLEPHIPRAPLPRMTKGPILYSREDLEPHLVNTPLPRASKGPVLYSAKVSQPLSTSGSQANVTQDPQTHGSKGTLPRVTKGPRFLATKIPRFRVPNLYRSFRRKRSTWSNLVRDSQASLTKGSRPSLARGSGVSLAKGSQPSLGNASIYPAPKKLPKNVKISSTGKKYCSASKWPF